MQESNILQYAEQALDYGVIGINPESGKFFIKTSLISDLIKKPVYSIKLPVRKICFLSL
jgi:hypothetical protein